MFKKGTSGCSLAIACREPGGEVVRLVKRRLQWTRQKMIIILNFFLSFFNYFPTDNQLDD